MAFNLAPSTSAAASTPTSTPTGVANTISTSTPQLTNTFGGLRLSSPSNTTADSNPTHSTNVLGATSTRAVAPTGRASFGSTPASNGTRNYPTFRPIIGRPNLSEYEHYETITRDPRFSNLSLEELRVADYAQEKTAALPVFSFGHSAQQRPAIEIVVGPDPLTDQRETWWLPTSLISHYSAFLKAACSHEFKEKEENRITLTDEDPKTFALFVEWMYYDKYSLIFDFQAKGDCSKDAKAWILGDRLMSVPFKNYAMERIYNRHTVFTLSAAVSTVDFEYVCANTTEGSKLRRFYIDFVVTHFAKPDKVVGKTKEWDNVLMDHDDARTSLLNALRLGGQQNLVCTKDMYIDKDTKSNLK
ncbi:hypothetical protein N0V90_000764 [Kalmusia sp. IMI 367209]|nr:hypothetical protein N0V90_000764 [Kalmusia sp. IMI 367209]